MNRRAARRSGQAGFTLIEMLVALSVFSLAALALIRLQGYTTRNSGELELRVVAQSVARNRAVELLTDPRPPSLGQSSGQEDNGGRTWIWVQNAKLTEEGQFIQVDITVQDAASGAPAALTILRPAGTILDAPPPAPPQSRSGPQKP